MANIYKSNYTGAKVDEAIRKVLNAAPNASDELQKKLKQGEKIIELSDQYIRITDLDTGIYRLTFNGTKYLYHMGKTSTNTSTVDTGSGPCLLYVQKNGETRWEWHYFYDSKGYKKMVIGGTGETSGSSNTLVLPNGMGTSGQFLKSMGSNFTPTWVNLPVPAGFGTSGQYLKSNGGGSAPTWVDFPESMAVINLANYDFSTVTNGTIKGITDLNADLAKLPIRSIIQFKGSLPWNAVNSSNKIVFPAYSTIIGLRYDNTSNYNYNLIFDDTTGNYLTFIQCYFAGSGNSTSNITRIINANKYHFIDCIFYGGITAGVYIDQNSISNNLVFDHCIFNCNNMPQSDVPGCIMINNCYNVTFNNCEISNNRGGANASPTYTNYCFYITSSTTNISGLYINYCFNSTQNRAIESSDIRSYNDQKVTITPSLPEPVSYVSTMPAANASSPSLVFLME